MPKPIVLLVLCSFTFLASSIYAATYFLSSNQDITAPIGTRNERVSSPTSAAKNQNGKSLTHQQIFIGKVDYSFVNSALDTGASSDEIKSLLDLTKSHFDVLSKATKGDEFVFKTDISQQNRSLVRAIYYRQEDREFFAYRGYDERIYNQNGEELDGLNTLLMPFKGHYRVSSSFSLSRRHPITHVVTPHYGTDYAVPVGTRVLSIAPGRVIQASYDHYAGNYIAIKHNNGVVTRYLHLGKRLVKLGHYVASGETIAISGNTGRTTGPHLHIELKYHGMPMDFEKSRRLIARANSQPQAAQEAIQTFALLKAKADAQPILELTRR